MLISVIYSIICAYQMSCLWGGRLQLPAQPRSPITCWPVAASSSVFVLQEHWDENGFISF